MGPRVLSRQEFTLKSEDDLSFARQTVRLLAEQRGFDAFAKAALLTVASELGRNVLVHGGGGVAAIEEVARNGQSTGIRLQVRDAGPGIPDVDRVLRGGYSTRKTLGLGLVGSVRLVDEFHIDSVVGRGTIVTITKWKREY